MNAARQLRDIAETVKDRFPVAAFDLQHIARTLEMDAESLADASLPVSALFNQPDELRPVFVGKLLGTVRAVCSMMRGYPEQSAEGAR